MRGESEGPTDAEIAAALSRQNEEIGGFQRRRPSTDHVGGENQGTETGFGRSGLNKDALNVGPYVMGPTRRGEPVGKVPTYSEYFLSQEEKAAQQGHAVEGYAAGILGKSDPEAVRKFDDAVEDIKKRSEKGEPLDNETAQGFLDKIRSIVEGEENEGQKPQ
jgi:hypothetical protein